MKLVKCTCCGGPAANKAHWFNRDAGTSVCIDCVEKHPDDFPRRAIGDPGEHWGAEDPERAKNVAMWVFERNQAKEKYKL